MRRPLVQSALTEALVREGGTLARIVRPVVDALQATLIIFTMGGMVVTNCPDHRVRLDAANVAIRMLGGIPRASELPQQPSPSLTVNISQNSPELVAEGLTGSENTKLER